MPFSHIYKYFDSYSHDSMFHYVGMCGIQGQKCLPRKGKELETAAATQLYQTYHALRDRLK